MSRPVETGGVHNLPARSLTGADSRARSQRHHASYVRNWLLRHTAKGGRGYIGLAHNKRIATLSAP